MSSWVRPHHKFQHIHVLGARNLCAHAVAHGAEAYISRYKRERSGTPYLWQMDGSRSYAKPVEKSHRVGSVLRRARSVCESLPCAALWGDILRVLYMHDNTFPKESTVEEWAETRGGYRLPARLEGGTRRTLWILEQEEVRSSDGGSEGGEPENTHSHIKLLQKYSTGTPAANGSWDLEPITGDPPPGGRHKTDQSQRKCEGFLRMGSVKKRIFDRFNFLTQTLKHVNWFNPDTNAVNNILVCTIEFRVSFGLEMHKTRSVTGLDKENPDIIMRLLSSGSLFGLKSFNLKKKKNPFSETSVKKTCHIYSLCVGSRLDSKWQLLRG